MESLSESNNRSALAASVAAVRVAEIMKAGQRDDIAALPVHQKLVASHDAMMSSVSHLAINCHRTSGRLYGEKPPAQVHRLRSMLGVRGAIAG